MARSTTISRAARSVLALLATLSLLLVGTPARAQYTPPEGSPFTDVPTTATFFKEIAWMYDQGISTGWSDGTYRPAQQVDRDAMAAFIYRLKGTPAWAAPANSPFTDISSSTQFYAEMTWLQSTGTTTGWPDGTYRPWNPTNRDAMAAFMYRLAGSPEYTPPTASPFTDITPTTQFYKEMCWLRDTGITTGFPDGTYQPWQPVTREVMATFMYRLATNVLKLPDPTQTGTLSVQDGSNGATWTANFETSLSGKSVWLQVKTIATTMTSEVSGSYWRTVASGTADAKGDATFVIPDPLRVTHQYRAVAGTGSARTLSNEVSYAAPKQNPGTGLATVYIDTNEGAAIADRETYHEGRVTITAGSTNGTTSGKSCTAIDNALLKVKGRGHSSWDEVEKKGYNFSLDKKADVCGMGAAKKWALVANHVDRSLLRNSTAKYVGSQFTNLEYNPEAVPVDVYLNGSFLGSYSLMERVNVGTGRVPIDELKPADTNISGGYLLEWDFRQSGDNNINVNNSNAWVAISEPDNGSGITSDQIAYITEYLAEADTALFSADFTDPTDGWQNYIDADSAVDYYIAMELMKPIDGNMHASVNMYKKRDGKIFFGPLWDFDIAMGNENNLGNQGSPEGWYLRDPFVPAIEKTQVDVSWFNRLNDDPAFQQMVKDRWGEVYPQLVDKVPDFIAAQRTLIADSAAENFQIWDVNQRLYPEQYIQGSWEAEVDHLDWWIKERLAWMNDQYA